MPLCQSGPSAIPSRHKERRDPQRISWRASAGMIFSPRGRFAGRGRISTRRSAQNGSGIIEDEPRRGGGACKPVSRPSCVVAWQFDLPSPRRNETLPGMHMSPTASHTAPANKQRWFQFSLRTLLVSMMVLGGGFAWVGLIVRRAVEQRQAVQAITKSGGHVQYAEPSTSIQRSSWLRTCPEWNASEPGGRARAQDLVAEAASESMSSWSSWSRPTREDVERADGSAAIPTGIRIL